VKSNLKNITPDATDAVGGGGGDRYGLKPSARPEVVIKARTEAMEAVMGRQVSAFATLVKADPVTVLGPQQQVRGRREGGREGEREREIKDREREKERQRQRERETKTVRRERRRE
jgi:hypothetical protein